MAAAGYVAAKAPQVCPVLVRPQSCFEVNAEKMTDREEITHEVL